MHKESDEITVQCTFIYKLQKEELEVRGCSVSVPRCSYRPAPPDSWVTPYCSGVTGCAAAFPGFLSEILRSEGCAAAGNFCPAWDEVCGMATQVATAVLCEALQRQLEFIAQARFLSSLVLSFVQGFPYAFCSITTASQGLILLSFPCAFEEDQVLILPCDRGISLQVLL